MAKEPQEGIAELEDRLIEVLDALDYDPTQISPQKKPGAPGAVEDDKLVSRRRRLEMERERLTVALTEKLKALGWDEARIATHLDELTG